MQPFNSSSPRRIHPIAVALLLAVQVAPVCAAAEPGPRGPDIPVTTMGLPLCPAVAMSASGDFEVVWNLYISGSHPFPQGTFARHFDRDGRPTHAAEIRLDSPRNQEVSDIRIVALPGSGYFVFWQEYRGQRSAMAGRFLDPEGRPTGQAFLLARNGRPVAAAVVDESLLVAWLDHGSPSRLRARQYDFDGHALGKILLLDVNALGTVGLAPLADGFVATWERFVRGSRIIVAQRFSLAGEPVGAALRVNESRLGPAFINARVASNGIDRFAIAWTTRVDLLDPRSGQLVSEDETRARLFDVNGESSPEAHPNQLHTGNQQTSGLAMNARGEALVTWQSDRNAAATEVDIAGRFLDPAGQPESQAFPMSQNRAGADVCPAPATDGADAWVVAWLKEGMGIFARRVAQFGQHAAHCVGTPVLSGQLP